MRRTLLIFWQTYWSNITRRSYLMFTLGLPFFIVAIPTSIVFIASLVIESVVPQTDPRPVGVVDESAVFADPAAYADSPVAMQAYDSREDAAVALAHGDIQAYYALPPHYWQTGEIVLTYDEAPSEEVRSMFERWVSSQVREQTPEDVLMRFQLGANFEHQNITSEEVFDATGYAEWMLVFALVYLVRSAGLFTSGYMYDSISSESRQRTIEIVLTSVSSLQFVLGKFFGLLMVGLTQLLIWGGGLFLAAVVGTAVFDLNLIELLATWEHLTLVISMLLGAYVLDQIMAAAAGMMRVSGGAGPQLFNVFSLATGLALVYAAYFLPRSPDTPLAVITSIFPLTSPIVLLVRIVASEVPTWQVVVSQVVLWGTAVLGLYALRYLLNANLVAYAERFQIRRWLKSSIVNRQS
jgi:ABC-2 type transport system permease protein